MNLFFLSVKTGKDVKDDFQFLLFDACNMCKDHMVFVAKGEKNGVIKMPPVIFFYFLFPNDAKYRKRISLCRHGEDILMEKSKSHSNA